ncbi:hypothetical protein PCANC_21797 [Puccinia coronata f. sp. avenae]|uniref:Heme haloperoxidase family profile domain-containing protein n=1 Tax=Puccinia coronata f. sp. avenae TaxID=200324 RepID=A0A2N5S5T6_9BASI|nr:hypothetical protein PCANC_21797 [Puccinia coronata f. sp. avenae]PLW23340.1 hypothetical protein PCASD_12317 [Puccinia coronata f. sp. avenae]PLW47794.1 hypothetical protein PCASD_04348 [Puccinia coronata f. sp. avenae]
MADHEAHARSHFQPSQAPSLLLLLSPFTDDFDPCALWGLRTLVTRGAIESIKFYCFVVFLTIADVLYVGLNLVTPARTRENVIPLPFSPHSPPPFSDHPFIFALCKLSLWLGPHAPQWILEWATWDGLLPDGYWPAVDRNLDLQRTSRSPCPALNALANHGIINKSGENLNFHRIASRISRTYNLSPTLAVQLLSAAWPLFKHRGQIDLYSLTTHGLIEHDASLLRPDLHESTLQDQTKPHQDLIEKHFPGAPTRKQTERINVQAGEGGATEREEARLKHSDFSKMLERRREECQAKNRSFHDKFLFKFFGSGNCGMLMEVFNGKLSEIRPFVGAGIPMTHHADPTHHYPRISHYRNKQPERAIGFLDLVNLEVLPHGDWRPSNLHHPWGLTIFKLIYSTLKIEART